MSSPVVPPERVVEVLLRTELGAAMWRAAHFQALSEAQEERIAALEAQHAPPAAPLAAVPTMPGGTGG